MPERVRAMVTDIMTAASNCSLYSDGHSSVDRMAKKVLRDMDGMYTDNSVSFTISNNTLVFNDFIKVSQKSMHITTFIEKLRRKGIEKVIVKKGVTPEEFSRFIAALSPPGRMPRSSPHIALTVVDAKQTVDHGMDVSSAINRSIERIRQIHGGLSKSGKLDMVGLEDIVVSFIVALKRESNILKIVAPVKSRSDYFFGHTANVSILSIFQAESMGLKGDILREVGLAGLLHDVGKMFVPTAILEKDSPFEDGEWEIMKQHTLYGARFLSGLQNVPRLSVIAAYEHHLRFNGSGYPATKRRGNKQHLVSQIISIADTFDTLRTERPYRQAIPVPVTAGILEKGSGTDFNPLLVNNFLRNLKKIGAV